MLWLFGMLLLLWERTRYQSQIVGQFSGLRDDLRESDSLLKQRCVRVAKIADFDNYLCKGDDVLNCCGSGGVDCKGKVLGGPG